MTPYLEELRGGWRALLSAFLGMAGGLTMACYVMGIMAPYLIAEFAWSKSQFALVSGLGLVSVIAFPIVGRLTDQIGVRLTALVGAIASPILFVALSQLHSLGTYAVLVTLQCFILVTTTPPVYCRVVMQCTRRARGLALGFVMAGPAAAVAVGGPLLNNFVAEHGWRAGYLALVAFTVITGFIAIVLLPPEPKKEPAKIRRKSAKGDYAVIFRTPAFWIIFTAILLVVMPQSMMMTQLNLVVAESGVSGVAASPIISFFAGGMVLGRFVTGFALDRFSPPLVSAIGLLMSAVGLFIFASPFDTLPMLILAATLFGMSCGAEGDVMPYLIARYFGVEVYSTVAGILAATVAVAGLISAVMLSLLLKAFDSFVPYLTLTGALVVIGSFIFLLLPADPVAEEGKDDTPKPNAFTNPANASVATVSQ
jgi:predicted MFS family arabinose efflux permease